MATNDRFDKGPGASTTVANGRRRDPRRIRALHVDEVRRILAEMRALLPSYREVAGDASFHYARNEADRLERIVQQQELAPEQLIEMMESILAQTHGIVRTIRDVRGAGFGREA